METSAQKILMIIFRNQFYDVNRLLFDSFSRNFDPKFRYLLSFISSVSFQIVLPKYVNHCKNFNYF